MTMKATMTKMVWGVVMVLAMAVPAGAQESIHPGAKLFVAPMDGGLDGFLRAELMKQKVPVILVSSEDGAEFILTGEAQERKSGWSEGWLTTKKDNSTGSVTLLSVSDKSIIWAEEAGDRSLMMGGLSRGGPRKVASRIAGKLKDFVKK